MAHRASCPVPHHTTGCVGLKVKGKHGSPCFMSCTTPYHRLCGLEVKGKHGSPCFMSCTTPYHRLCGLEVKGKHGSPCFMSCTTPYHRLCGFEANGKHGSSCFIPVPHHTTGCVGLRRTVSMAHCASLEHVLRELGPCFSCSVYK